MATDITGGLAVDREFLFASQPDDPEMRESVNCWMWNNNADFGMPRIGIEAVGDNWDSHDVQVNIAFADGRALGIFEPGAKHNPIGADGKARILGAGPFSFELIEPFRHWHLHLDGFATVTTVSDQMEGKQSAGEKVPVYLDVEIKHTVPPWEVGSLLDDAGQVLANQDEGALVGGPRFEQLFRATGFMKVGEQEFPIDGGGLRVRRTGVRRLGTFRGHCWQSALFPSGAGFGFLTFPARDDGKPTLNEGFVFTGDGQLVPARVIKVPWLKHKIPNGENVSAILESELGRAVISAESVLSVFHPMPIGAGAGFVLQQAIVRYSWNGESAHGMMERSTDISLMAE